MDGSALKEWRKQLRFTQEEAGRELGVVRQTIQNWENKDTTLPLSIDLACQEFMRRWKRRPDFGPVLLVYGDNPMWPPTDRPHNLPVLHCEPYPHNEAAIRRALQLRDDENFFNPYILEEGDNVVWNCPELLLECDRRRGQAER
jgi:DNA-binding XRE family transcriptional regulator